MEDSMSVMRRRNERQGDGMEFKKAAEVLIAREPNYSPFNDGIYRLDLDRVRNLLAMAMRIAAEETFRMNLTGPIELSARDANYVAARIESRIGEK